MIVLSRYRERYGTLTVCSGLSHFPAMLVPIYSVNGHQHGISIQSSVNLGETPLQITYDWTTSQLYSRSPGGCLYINRLSYPRFLTLFIEWLWFLFLIAWQCKPRTGVRIWRLNLVEVGALYSVELTLAKVYFSCK